MICQIPDSANSRNKEVTASSDGHESCESVVMFVERLLLSGEFATALIVPDDRILFVVQVIKGGIVGFR